MAIYSMQFELLKGLLEPSKVVLVIPFHGVHVGLADFLCKDGMGSCKKAIKIFVLDECLLLEYLCVDVW